MRGRRAAKVNATRKVVAYIRVSTEEQATQGVSLDAQRARIDAYATAMGLVIDQTIVDAGLSAKSLDRDGMKQIIAGVKAGEISAMIVLKIDRATRSVRDLSTLLELFSKHDCAFVSVSENIDTGTAAGRMIVNLMGVLAQFEREQIAERTSFALAHKRKKGKVYSPLPFGYRRDGDRLVPIEAQQAALSRMRAMHDDGASLMQIAAMLEASGVQPPRGGARWYASSVRSILRSKIAQEVAA